MQEGTYLSSGCGDLTKGQHDSKWAIPQNVTDKFPPTFVSCAKDDRYVPHTDGEKLVKVFEEQSVKGR